MSSEDWNQPLYWSGLPYIYWQASERLIDHAYEMHMSRAGVKPSVQGVSLPFQSLLSPQCGHEICGRMSAASFSYQAFDPLSPKQGRDSLLLFRLCTIGFPQSGSRIRGSAAPSVSGGKYTSQLRSRIPYFHSVLLPSRGSSVTDLAASPACVFKRVDRAEPLRRRSEIYGIFAPPAVRVRVGDFLTGEKRAALFHIFKYYRIDSSVLIRRTDRRSRSDSLCHQPVRPFPYRIYCMYHSRPHQIQEQYARSQYRCP